MSLSSIQNRRRNKQLQTTQQSIKNIKLIWDQLASKYKSLLRHPQHVQIYSKREENKFSNAMIYVNQESPNQLEYYYLNTKNRKRTIDLMRIEKKRGVIWCDEAYNHLKYDKNINVNVKDRIKRDVLVLFKDDDFLEVYVMFTEVTDFQIWTSSLKIYIGMCKGTGGVAGTTTQNNNLGRNSERIISSIPLNAIDLNANGANNGNGGGNRINYKITTHPEYQGKQRSSTLENIGFTPVKNMFQSGRNSTVKQIYIDRIRNEINLSKIEEVKSNYQDELIFTLTLYSDANPQEQRIYKQVINVKEFKRNEKVVLDRILSNIRLLHPIDKEIVVSFIKDQILVDQEEAKYEEFLTFLDRFESRKSYLNTMNQNNLSFGAAISNPELEALKSELAFYEKKYSIKNNNSNGDVLGLVCKDLFNLKTNLLKSNLKLQDEIYYLQNPLTTDRLSRHTMKSTGKLDVDNMNQYSRNIIPNDILNYESIKEDDQDKLSNGDYKISNGNDTRGRTKGRDYDDKSINDNDIDLYNDKRSCGSCKLKMREKIRKGVFRLKNLLEKRSQQTMEL